MGKVTNINAAKGRKKRRVTREAWHGTYNGYSNHKCRCDDCRAAGALFMAEYRARKFGGKLCRMKNCPRVASQATGNGLCAHHHELRKALRAKKKRRLKAVR